MAGISANPGNGPDIAFSTIGTKEYQIIEDIYNALGRGEVSGVGIVQKFGMNLDVDTGTDPEDVWEGGGEYTGMPVSDSEKVEIYSSGTNAADDAAAGTGARTVRIQGLDASWEEQSEDLTMNGTTPVESTGTYRRVNRAYVLTAGSGGANAETLIVRHVTTTANVFCSMLPGYNQTNIAAYTIPSGKTGYLVGAICSLVRASGAAGSGTVTLRTRDTATADSVFRARETAQISNSLGYQRRFVPIELPAQTDIKWRCDEVSDNNSVLTGQFVILLIDD